MTSSDVLDTCLSVQLVQAADELLADLDMVLDVDHHLATVHERVTWTNNSTRATEELVFNAHSHYQPYGKDTGFLAKQVETLFIAKTLELLRMSPTDALATGGPACEIIKVTAPATEIHSSSGQAELMPSLGAELPFRFREDNATALVVTLPRPVGPGETVTVNIDFLMHLPQKQGRWGQWKGVTFLSNWQPVLAVYDESGWQPTPFIPWHQPFFNEAGGFHVLTLTASVRSRALQR
jgi:hypothetical protein